MRVDTGVFSPVIVVVKCVLPERISVFFVHVPSGQLLGEALNIDEYGQQTPVEPEPLLAGPGEFVDHFRHNAEAYASGNYSCASFRPPRSRSPTPGMNDEDYHIVVSDDVQPGTDEAPQYPQYGHNRYPNKKYGDTSGQDTFYDCDDGGKEAGPPLPLDDSQIKSRDGGVSCLFLV